MSQVQSELTAIGAPTQALGTARLDLHGAHHRLRRRHVDVCRPFGGLTFAEAPRLAMNLPTPWIGLWERITISVFLLWMVMLAVMLWPARPAPVRNGRVESMRPATP